MTCLDEEQAVGPQGVSSHAYSPTVWEHCLQPTIESQPDCQKEFVANSRTQQANSMDAQSIGKPNICGTTSFAEADELAFLMNQRCPLKTPQPSIDTAGHCLDHGSSSKALKWLMMQDSHQIQPGMSCLRVLLQGLNEAEDVVPPPTVEPRRVLPQLKQDLIHLEGCWQRLNEAGGL